MLDGIVDVFITLVVILGQASKLRKPMPSLMVFIARVAALLGLRRPPAVVGTVEGERLFFIGISGKLVKVQIEVGPLPVLIGIGIPPQLLPIYRFGTGTVVGDQDFLGVPIVKLGYCIFRFSDGSGILVPDIQQLLPGITVTVLCRQICQVDLFSVLIHPVFHHSIVGHAALQIVFGQIGEIILPVLFTKFQLPLSCGGRTAIFCAGIAPVIPDGDVVAAQGDFIVFPRFTRPDSISLQLAFKLELQHQPGLIALLYLIQRILDALTIVIAITPVFGHSDIDVSQSPVGDGVAGHTR